MAPEANRVVALERLRWKDRVLDTIATPQGEMTLLSGDGPGLATRAADPPGTVWAVGDRGPNPKVCTAVERRKLDHLRTRISSPGLFALMGGC